MGLFASLSFLDASDLHLYLIVCAATVAGEAFRENCLVDLGIMVLKTGNGFNEAAGFTSLDDRLRDFSVKDPLAPWGFTFDAAGKEADPAINF
jgi:aldehyde:ferredoxin oxidoreductase